MLKMWLIFLSSIKKEKIFLQNFKNLCLWYDNYDQKQLFKKKSLLIIVESKYSNTISQQK